MKKFEFTVVVPCYNEENAIFDTIASLHECLKDMGNYEIIIVNDGSSDNTLSMLEKASQKYPALKTANHATNKGYGAALKTGIRRANSEMIVITDADGTYPNERLPELIQIAKETDMVVGARVNSEEVTYPLIRKIPKWFLVRYASWMAGQKIPDMNSGMRVFRKKIAERFINILPDGFSFTTTITLAMLTNHYDVRYVPIGYSARIGKSKIRPVHDTLNFIQLILRTGMYFAPLRVFAPIILLLGLGFSVSFGYDLYQGDLTEKTLLLLMFTLNAGMFALLADMIDKRSSR